MSINFNPEFQRNLWLHLGWQRLTAAATVSLTIAYAILLVSDFNKLSYAANLILVMVLGMWGPRRAADSLAEEIAGGTWEAQRMSSLSAWSMVWGKLVGGCSFVWYCGLLALAIYIFAGYERGFPAGRAGNFWLGIYLVLIGACLGHVVALGVALLRLRKTIQYRRLTITLAQSCGFVVFLIVSGIGTAPVLNQDNFDVGSVYFYNSAHSWPLIRAVLASVFVFWALAAVYRLMRVELQHRAWPWLWLSFVLFCAILAAGIAPWPDSGVVGSGTSVFITMTALTYFSALADRRDPIRYRSALLAWRRKDFSRAIAEFPWWLVASIASFGAAIFAIYALVDLDNDTWPSSLLALLLRLRIVPIEHLAESFMLILLFMIRDLAVLLCLSFSAWRTQSDITWLVYLTLIYWPLGVIIYFAGYGEYITVVLPVAGDNVVMNFAPVLVQLTILGAVLRHCWYRATQSGVAA